MLNMTAFTLLVDKTQYNFNKGVIARYNQIMDLSAEYDNGDYTIMEVDVMMSGRKVEELCTFVFACLDFIAIHQEESTYIIAKDKDLLKTALTNTYGKGNGIYFIYDMLTISERYDCLLVLDDCTGEEDRLIHYEGSAIYSLLLDRNSKYLFTDEPNVTIEAGYTGIQTEVDITDGMDIYEFHVAIIGQKS